MSVIYLECNHSLATLAKADIEYKVVIGKSNITICSIYTVPTNGPIPVQLSRVVQITPKIGYHLLWLVLIPSQDIPRASCM